MKNFLIIALLAMLSLGISAQTILFESSIDSVMKRTRDYRLTGVNIDNYSSYYYEIGSFIPNNKHLAKNEKLELGRSFSFGYTFKKDIAEMSSIVFGASYFRRTQRLNSDQQCGRVVVRLRDLMPDRQYPNSASVRNQRG